VTPRIPPIRVCPDCGGQHRAWAERQPCSRCAEQAAIRQTETAAELRAQRLGRRQESLDGLEGPVPVPYNVFPEGY
jgi:hypothetical protein